MKTRIDFLNSLKSDFELWQNHPLVYKKKVDKISDLFNLKKYHRFESKLLPSGFSSRIDQKNNFVMFELNPGLKRKFNEREELKQMID